MVATATKKLDLLSTTTTVKQDAEPERNLSSSELTREQLVAISGQLAAEACDILSRRRRGWCKACSIQRLVRQLGICRKDLDAQNEEMKKRSKSPRRATGVSWYIVPCRCGSCSHRCDRVYLYPKIRRGAVVDLNSREAEERKLRAINNYKRKHPEAIMPGDPRWVDPAHKHSHKEGSQSRSHLALKNQAIEYLKHLDKRMTIHSEYELLGIRPDIVGLTEGRVSLIAECVIKATVREAAKKLWTFKQQQTDQQTKLYVFRFRRSDNPNSAKLISDIESIGVNLIELVETEDLESGETIREGVSKSQAEGERA